MKRISLLLFFVTILLACESKHKICECIEEGQIVNTMSARMTEEVGKKMTQMKHHYQLLNKAKQDSMVDSSTIDSLQLLVDQDSIFVFIKKDSLQLAITNRDAICGSFEQLTNEQVKEAAKNCPTLHLDAVK